MRRYIIRSAAAMAAALETVQQPSPYDPKMLRAKAKQWWWDGCANYAFHEAGHAVAAYKFCGRVYECSLGSPDGAWSGRVRSCCFEPMVSQAQEIAFFLAGPLAEARFLHVPIEATLYGLTDWDKIQARLREWGYQANSDAPLFRAAMVLAVATVDKNWRAIEKLAKEVAEHRCLRNEQVEALIAVELPIEEGEDE